MSLATKYRPHTYEEVCGQNITVTLLKKAVEQNKFSNTILLAGASGCGKTTLARIFANDINHGVGTPEEINASNTNGVDDVRAIIDLANQRALVGEYRTFIIDECVSGDTEVLTSTGWKRFDQLDKTEKIAQYTTHGAIEFVTPTEFIEKDYSGDMYNISIGDKATFLMSPNHVQPLYYNKSKKIKEQYIKDIKFAQSNNFIRSGLGIGKNTTLSYLDKLAIALQADGCLQSTYDLYNYWTICVKKQNKKDLITEILEHCGLEYKKLSVDSRKDCLRYSIKTPKSLTKKLSTYFSLTTMSASYAKEFVKELMNWDGFLNNKYFYYSCTDRDNVDFCQAVGILGGFKSRIGVQSDKRSLKHKQSYRLYLEETFIGTANQHIKKELIKFTGKIYCVKVPSHMIIIRKDGFELITGNCHMITKEGWSAFLKGIEECPKYTVFIFCTTDPNKLPETILNRVQRYNIMPIKSTDIKTRLEYICKQEGFINYEKTCELISKTCHGGMRDAIATLEQCTGFSTDLNIENTKQILGESSFETMFKLTWALQQKDDKELLYIIDNLYNTGKDLKQFISVYLDFVLDLTKYILFKDISITSIPEYLASADSPALQFTVEKENSLEYFRQLTNVILNIKQVIKYDNSYKSTIEVMLLAFSRGTK